MSVLPTLTIGLPTYDDFDGVFFTVESILMHHSLDLEGCQLIVVDNNPDSKKGQRTKTFMESWIIPGVKHWGIEAKYVPFSQKIGTAAAKQAVIDHATRDAVLVMDSHVLLYPDSIGRLRRFYYDNPDTRNLYTGPLFYANLRSSATHFDNVWSGEMWGVWGHAWMHDCGYVFTVTQGNMPDANGKPRYRLICVPLFKEDTIQIKPLSACPKCGKPLPQPGKYPWENHEPILAGYNCIDTSPPMLPHDAPTGIGAFEVPANGMGLFSCRRDAWQGFNPHFTGFGGEEYYIHHKFKQAGHGCYNLPWLRWVHRFSDSEVSPIPYPLTVWHKVRNYVIGFQELGLDLTPIYQHFVRDRNGKQRLNSRGNIMFTDDMWEKLLADPIGNETPPGTSALTGNEVVHQQRRINQPPVDVVPLAPAAKEKPCPQAAADEPPTVKSPCNVQSLEDIYDRSRKIPSDINEHITTLYALAKLCNHVTEFGTRGGVSTAALAFGLAEAPDRSPKLLITYDINRSNAVNKIVRFAPDHLKVIHEVANVIEMEPIEETDLLFIDTIHTAEQLSKELALHADRARKWIVMHDTMIFGERGENGKAGLLPALRQFLKTHPEWTVRNHYTNNNGLTVLTRLDYEKRPRPSMFKMAGTFAKALVNHVATGAKAAPTDKLERRLSVCSLCEHRNNANCGVCGCNVAAKASWNDSECPLGKWAEVDNATDWHPDWTEEEAEQGS